MKHAARFISTGLLAVTVLFAAPAVHAHRQGLPPSLQPATAAAVPAPVPDASSTTSITTRLVLGDCGRP